MKNEEFFSDKNIAAQTTATIERKDGTKTKAVSLAVLHPAAVGGVEIILEYAELKAAIDHLEAEE